MPQLLPKTLLEIIEPVHQFCTTHRPDSLGSVQKHCWDQSKQAPCGTAKFLFLVMRDNETVSHSDGEDLSQIAHRTSSPCQTAETAIPLHVLWRRNGAIGGSGARQFQHRGSYCLSDSARMNPNANATTAPHVVASTRFRPWPVVGLCPPRRQHAMH